MEHHFGERCEFRSVHPANPDGHQPRRHLVIRDFPACIARYEERNLFAGKFTGITFFADQVDGAHACGKRWAG